MPHQQRGPQAEQGPECYSRALEVDLVQSCREEDTQKINIDRGELQTSQITTKKCGCLGRKKVGKSEAQ